MEPKILLDDIAILLQQPKKKIKIRLKKLNKYKVSGGKIFLTHNETIEFFKDITLKEQIMTFHLIKGGVGKTTLVHSIASRASLYGAKVLCIDLDQQANLTQAFNFFSKKKPNVYDIFTKKLKIKDTILSVCPGIDLIPSALSNANLDTYLYTQSSPIETVFNKLLEKIKLDYDLIIFDCPPTLSQSVKAAILASSTVVLPINPDLFSIEGLRIGLHEINQLKETYSKKINTKIVINKFDKRTVLSNRISQFLFENPRYKEVTLSPVINLNQEFTNHLSDGKSIYDSSSQKGPAKEIDAIVKKLLEIKICKN